MIISHRHKFIFIKNRKVAGTSMELALVSLCGPQDVLSPDTPERSRVSKSDELMQHARNYEGGFNILTEIAQDMRTSSVRARIGAAVWDSYYTFCFDRNPWDKMVSFYYRSSRHTPGEMDLNAFICAPKQGHTLDQKYPTDWDRYTLKNKLSAQSNDIISRVFTNGIRTFGYQAPPGLLE